MKRMIGWLSALIVGAALVYGAILLFGFLTAPSDQVEGLDNLIARVDEAAKAGHVATGLAAQECQASTPLHIDALVQDFLQGKPVLTCSAELGPAAPLGKPLTVVDLDRKRFDAVNRRLPAAILAPNAAAAATIVFTHCSKAKVGSYGFIFSHTAFRRDCGMLFVGKNGSSNMQILGIRTETGWPPRSIDSRFTFGDIVADRPIFDMQNYIVFRSAAGPMAGDR